MAGTGCLLKRVIKSLGSALLGAALALCQAAVGFAQATGSRLPPAVAAQHEGAVDVTGDKTIYNSANDSFTVRGHAVLTQGPSVLTANEIILMRKQRRAQAIGDVHLVDPEVELWATKAQIDLDRETLALYKAKVFAKRNIYHLEGKKIYKLGGQNYSVVDGFFTTCGCESGTPDWSVAADHMDVTMGESGYARKARFSVLGYPLLTLPYFEFPADTSRHSGFLTGREGQSGLRGFQYVQPYYIAINKSSDATVALDIETSQRVGGLAEYRLTNGVDDYLWVDGAFYNESLRSQANRQGDIIDEQIADPHIPIDRYGFIAMTRQHLFDGLTAYGDTVLPGDSLYLREMNVWTLSRGFYSTYGNSFPTMRDAISHFGLLDEYYDGFARLQGTWHNDLIQEQGFALQQLPQLWVSGRRDLPGGLAYLDYDAEAVNYWAHRSVSGLRFSLNPRLTAPWRWGDYLYGWGTVGTWANVYDTSGHAVAITPVGSDGLDYNNGLGVGRLTAGGLNTRWIPYVEGGMGTELERVYDINWESIEKIKHIIEPFVDYTYVPNVAQSGLPLFDEWDRVEPRSLMVYGLTTRVFARMRNSSEQAQDIEENAMTETEAAGTANSGTEGYGPYGGPAGGLYPMTGANENQSGRSAVRELLRLTLMQAYDTNYSIASGGPSLSDLQGIINIFPTSVFSLGSQLAFDPRSSPGLSIASVGVSFQPWWTNNVPPMYMGKALNGSFLQLSYNYMRPRNTVENTGGRSGVEYFALRSYYDVFDRLGLYFAPSYDLASGRMLQAEYGIRIKSPCDCWAFDVGITDSFNPGEVQVQVQLTLGGLGSIGQSPFGRNPFSNQILNRGPTSVLPTY
jgi:LPS-assembly protein